MLGGINGQSIARRLGNRTAAGAAGIEGRITGHSGRVNPLPYELPTRRGAPEQATAKAVRVEVRHGWLPTTRFGRRSRAGRRRYLPVAGAGSDRKRRGGSTSDKSYS